MYKVVKRVKGIKLIEDLEDKIRDIQDQYPEKKILCVADKDKLEYTINVYDEQEDKTEITVPVFLETSVVYGDSVAEYTPVLVRRENEAPRFKRIDEIDCTYQVWSASGWTDIKRVISHKVTKQMYRVWTHSGCVDVTEDHSLIDTDYNLITPRDYLIGQELLTNELPKYTNNRATSSDYNYSYIGVNSKDFQLKLANAYWKMSTDTVPIFTSTYNIVRLSKSYPQDLVELNKVQRVDTLPEGENTVYDLETETGLFQAGIGCIIVKNTDSVMCRFKYNRKDKTLNRHDTFKLSCRAGDYLTEHVFARPPIEMEFEKVFNPFLLKGKKNYVAKMYDNLKDPMSLTKIHIAGVASTRRNYCDYYKRYADEIYDCFLEEHLEDIVKITAKYIGDIMRYNIDLKDLTISSSLAGKYKVTSMPHLHVVEKLRERKQDVQIGDRIPYVFIEVDNPKDQKYMKAEDPEYTREHNLKFNRGVYLEHIAKPILGFMAPLLRDRQELLIEIFDMFNGALEECGSKKLPKGILKLET
jgi:DNA polymerase family B